ncbi:MULTISPECIES: putative T7SS-secreted protein [unclassified Streptomyces]|uniref:putative T7SS-secreted protein n=1 Tax=unclassified Streptomyces TaxID=2593676 RepID=UPI000AA1D131|nr:hypothetical protein [Streptomyces sp. CNQ-509]
MARPTDWQPLADSDPVPGNVEDIRDEAARLKKIGETIESQVGKLRDIGKDGALKGKYADKLRSAATDLAGKMEKTSGRYKEVAGHLSTWAGDLDEAQKAAERALTKAQSAAGTMAQNKPPDQASSPDAPEPTDDEKEAEKRREKAYGAAEGELEEARRMLGRATSARDRDADTAAGRIKKSIDDDVKDSWWDNVKDFVDKYADIIKIVIDVISWIATAVAIISLFIPGLNVVAFLLIAGLLVVGGRALLAATGNASWMEVLVDAVGLLTMGLGRAGMAALKGTNALTKTAATGARSQQVAQNLARSSAQRQALGRVLSSRTASPAAKRSARAQIDALKAQARRQATSVPQNLPSVGRLGKILNMGDTEGLSLIRNIGRISDRFPGLVSGGTAAKAGAAYSASLGAAWGGTIVDLGDKAFGSSDMLPFKPFNDSYNDWKGDTWKAPIGSTW